MFVDFNTRIEKIEEFDPITNHMTRFPAAVVTLITGFRVRMWYKMNLEDENYIK